MASLQAASLPRGTVAIAFSVHFECSRWVEYNDQLLPDGDHTNTEISHIGKSLGPPRNRNTLSSGFRFYVILNSIVWNAAVDEYVH